MRVDVSGGRARTARPLGLASSLLLAVALLAGVYLAVRLNRVSFYFSLEGPWELMWGERIPLDMVGENDRGELFRAELRVQVWQVGPAAVIRDLGWTTAGSGDPSHGGRPIQAREGSSDLFEAGFPLTPEESRQRAPSKQR